MKVWTLEEAVKLVRALQAKTREFGYHLTLGGGVLNNGFSKKDVDLYFLPLNNSSYQEKPKELVEWLVSMWGKGNDIKNSSEANTREKYIIQVGNNGPEMVMNPEYDPNSEREVPFAGTPVYKNKLKFLRPSGDRIDVFVL